jgi:hypothetical protein
LATNRKATPPSLVYTPLEATSVLHLDFGPRYPPGTLGHELPPELLDVDPQESKRLDLPRVAIHSVVATMVPDPRDDRFSAKWSTLAITYRDSYEVVDAFTLTLGGEAYWVKAGRKLLVEKLGIAVTVV